MVQMPDPNMIYLVSADGLEKSVIINLSQVRMVTEMGGGHCKIWFSETHFSTLTGQAANEFSRLLTDRSIMTNGEPFGPVAERAERAAIKSQSS
jgi:hypothetical protein